MTKAADLRADAYVFWEAASDFRRELRAGVFQPDVVAEEMKILADMTDWPLMKQRCAEIALAVTSNAQRMLT